MTTEQFTTWLMEQEILRRRRKDPIKACDAVGIGGVRRRTLVHGRDLPSKIEALACAHYAHRMELPFALESAAMAAFVESHFASVAGLADDLEVLAETLTAQLRGYRVNAHKEQVPAPINPTLARALHWCAVIGPVSPYGGR